MLNSVIFYFKCAAAVCAAYLSFTPIYHSGAAEKKTLT